MIERYLLLADRINSELLSIEKAVARAETAINRSTEQTQDAEFFAASAAFDLQGFYSGFERLFELIANEIDDSLPVGPSWHRDLLTQMAQSVPDVRPAVISSDTASALSDYLEFRHVVRNMYTFNLKSDRVAELVGGSRSAYNMAQRDLTGFG